MIIDGKGKLFGKVNVMDLLVVIVLVAGIGGLAYKFTKSSTVSPFVKTSSIELEFYSEEISDFVATKIEKGDIVKDFEKATNFGTVKEVKLDKAISVAQTYEGKLIPASRPGCSSVRFVAEGKGVRNKDGVTVDNTDYFIGKTIILRVGKSVLVGRIYNINYK